MNKWIRNRVAQQLVGPNAARLSIAALLILGVISWGRSAAPAAATTITVTTTADELNTNGNCSLREAIIAANTDTAVDACPAGNGGDTIILPAGTFNLTRGGPNENDGAVGDLDINGSLAISGAGWNTTIIDANGLDRVFDIRNGHVTLNGMQIRGGATNTGDGGGIRVNSGSLLLYSVRIVDNSTTASGGGISVNEGVSSLNVQYSHIYDNTAGSGGGGIYTAAPLSMGYSMVYDNQGTFGGGIANSLSNAFIVNSTIYDNLTTAVANGGGGIYSSGNATLINSTISGNRTNRANGGGMTQTGSGTGRLHNVTITQNEADTLVNNSGNGGGLFIGPNAKLYLGNTILAGNTDHSGTTPHHDCSGPISHGLGYNLITSPTGCAYAGVQTGNVVLVDPNLGYLDYNNGLTLNHVPLSDSPAIDAGNPTGCTDNAGQPLTTDQRDFMRPNDGNFDGTARCDIGAIEAFSFYPPTPTFTPTPTHTQVPAITGTPTATATPTDGPSPTPSATATEGPSPTPSATATDGPSPTPTMTDTPGPSPTPFPATDWIYLPLALDD